MIQRSINRQHAGVAGVTVQNLPHRKPDPTGVTATHVPFDAVGVIGTNTPHGGHSRCGSNEHTPL